MCRLFALHADQPVTAKFWLLDAPYSLAHQSRFNADGTGIGWFDDQGIAHVAKRPVAAYDSTRYAHMASQTRSRALVAHVRNSSGASNTMANTHPFLRRGVLFVHNGVLRVDDRMRQRVRELGAADDIEGDTDSEWLFALILGETAAHGGDVHHGLVAAATWVLENIPVYSLNLLLAKDEHLYALRAPATNELWVRDRPAGGRDDHGLHQVSETLEATSADLREVRSVVIASEPMDDSDDWRLMENGELLHISPEGDMDSEYPLPAATHELGLEDLGLGEAASQAHAAEAAERAERRAKKAEANRRRVA